MQEFVVQQTEGYLLQALEEVHSVLNRCATALLASAMIAAAYEACPVPHMALSMCPLPDTGNTHRIATVFDMKNGRCMSSRGCIAQVCQG